MEKCCAFSPSIKFDCRCINPKVCAKLQPYYSVIQRFKVIAFVSHFLLCGTTYKMIFFKNADTAKYRSLDIGV